MVACVGVVKVRACKGVLGVLLKYSTLHEVRDFDWRMVKCASTSIGTFLCDSKATVTLQKFCTTQKIIYLPQVLETSYHINVIIYKYSIYIFDMNMRFGSHALLHVGKSEK